MENKKARKWLINIGKILISILMLYWVFTKIPFSEVLSLWTKVEEGYLVLAALFFLASQVVSTKRLELCLKSQGFYLSFKSNLELYFLGMFYNFFIPGGIGGDAYKVYLLNKKLHWSTKKVTLSLFVDRLSGLMAIVFLGIALAYWVLPQFWYGWTPLLLIGGFSGFFFIKLLFPNFKKNYWSTLALSLLVQILQVICFAFLLKGIGANSGFVEYALLFLASSVLSLISFAGIGVREMLFLQASKYFDFSPELSISASLLFTVITALFSLLGLYFQLRTINLKTTQ